MVILAPFPPFFVPHSPNKRNPPPKSITNIKKKKKEKKKKKKERKTLFLKNTDQGFAIGSPNRFCSGKTTIT
jgi:hypothetical protein